MSPLANFFLSYAPFRLPSHLSSFVRGKTPFSTTPVVVSMLAVYLATIFGIRAMMTDRQPYKLTFLLRMHGMFLSLFSALLLALMLEEVIPQIWKQGLYHALCAVEAWTPRLEFYYIINYYLKYIELLDSVFLALKKKPLRFLHVFHHFATALMAFIVFGERPSSVWMPYALNLAVHVVMYYYYFTTAGGARPWWKKHLTTIQIAQLLVDLCVVAFCSYLGLSHRYITFLPHFSDCAGGIVTGVSGCGLLTINIGLFLNFFFQMYIKPTWNTPNGTANGRGNGNAYRKPGSILHKTD